VLTFLGGLDDIVHYGIRIGSSLSNTLETRMKNHSCTILQIENDNMMEKGVKILRHQDGDSQSSAAGRRGGSQFSAAGQRGGSGFFRIDRIMNWNYQNLFMPYREFVSPYHILNDL
jgi:hypothetical protein